MAELNAIENIQAVRLDVTDQAQIDAAVKTITEAGRGLYGLINNAGVGALYPLTEAPDSEVEWLMDVNLYGPFRVTKAFAPLIVESKGYDKEDSPYKAYYERISGWVNEDASAADQGGDPQQVAQAALQAMFSENPKRRYLVVPNQEQASWTIKKAIEELVQLNQDHAFSYSRDDLVKMLDEALSANP